MLITLPFHLSRKLCNDIKGRVDSELYHNPIVKDLTIDITYGLSFEITDVLPGTEQLVKDISTVINNVEFHLEVQGDFVGAIH